MIRLTATLNILKTAEIRDIFLESFYYKDTDMLKSEFSLDEINQYLNNRNFIRTISAIGQYNLPIFYTQVTSKYRFQSDATALSSRKITQRNSRLLPSYLTMKSALWHTPKGRVVLLYVLRYQFSI